MEHKKQAAMIAIVGFGPRGLGALEALTSAINDAGTTASVDVFDPFPWPGAGPNYDPEQSDLCLLNIPMRSLDINPPAFLADQMNSFSNWSLPPYRQEDFPPRSKLGAYFNARYRALVLAAGNIIETTQQNLLITGLEHGESGWWLCSDGARH